VSQGFADIEKGMANVIDAFSDNMKSRFSKQRPAPHPHVPFEDGEG